MAEENKIQGWKDVQITPDMPLSVIVNFLNVLNQRLVALEDVTKVPFNNQMISLTELYSLQAQAQAEAAAKAQAEAAEKAKQGEQPKNTESVGA